MLLVVDNDRLPLDPWIDMLEDAGYQIEFKNHADRALKFAETTPDIEGAVIDVMMPAPADWGGEAQGGMASGVVLAQKLREKHPDLPIIFLTGQMNQAIIGKLKRFGQPSAWLAKLDLRDSMWLDTVKRVFREPRVQVPVEVEPETA
jgi:CheY-like chemotaxis protein